MRRSPGSWFEKNGRCEINHFLPGARREGAREAGHLPRHYLAVPLRRVTAKRQSGVRRGKMGANGPLQQFRYPTIFELLDETASLGPGTVFRWGRLFGARGGWGFPVGEKKAGLIPLKDRFRGPLRSGPLEDQALKMLGWFFDATLFFVLSCSIPLKWKGERKQIERGAWITLMKKTL